MYKVQREDSIMMHDFGDLLAHIDVVGRVPLLGFSHFPDSKLYPFRSLLMKKYSHLASQYRGRALRFTQKTFDLSVIEPIEINHHETTQSLKPFN